MLSLRLRHLCLLLASMAPLSCGDDISDPDGEGASLDDFLPEIPEPTGEPQSTWAGVIGEGDEVELIPGPASSGIVGDVYLRNSRGRFVVQAASRVLGVVPQGGNVVDAVPLGEDGGDMAPDHFGEMSMFYVLGRTCEHTSIEVLRDGSGGGAAVVRARGVAAPNDFINIRGVGLLNIPVALVPDFPDDVECATTYVLEPDSPYLSVQWTLFNGGDASVTGPFGMLNDTGGEVGVWTPGKGFGRVGSITDVVAGGGEGATAYAVYQGPGVAYGIVPVHDEADTPNASVSVLGVSLLAYGATKFLDIIDPEKKFLDLAPQDGRTMAAALVVGLDASDIEGVYRGLRGDEVATATGTVTWDDGEPGAGARVAAFEDADGDGAVSADDPVASFADAAPDGSYELELPPGNYLVRAEVESQGRSEAVELSLGAGGATDVDLEMPKPIRYDYRILDSEDEAGGFLPARLVVIGDSPVNSDPRLYSQYDRPSHVVKTITAVRGTSVDLGGGADPALYLAPGAEYRIFAMRGTEWSVAQEKLTPIAGEEPDELALVLTRVVDTTGYLGTEYHVHSINSPDSPITEPDRVESAVADGIELFAATDHDFVSDLQPVVEMLGLERFVRIIPGVEVSTMVYGHFNAYPIDRDPSSPNGGAIDWPAGADGFAKIPSEIFAAARERGAEIVQINHPRRGPEGSTDITEHFDRMNLTFDYDARTISGDEPPVPREWLRLPPDGPLFSLDFNALEVWNGFGVADTNEDGVRELTRLDVVMRDWFNFLSFGKMLTPMGNSDTHTVWKDQLGMPRTFVRVTDDSPEAIASGAVVDEVLDTIAGRGDAPIDIVVSNGPHLQVTADGDPQPLGKVIAADDDGEVELTIDVMAPDWAAFDTVEVYANATPAVNPDDDVDVTVLSPLACFTSREPLDPADPCMTAPIRGTLTVTEVGVGDATRYEAQVVVTIAADEIPVREGATGSDAWLVVRTHGQRPIYPVMFGSAVTSENLATLVDAESEAAVEAAIAGRGILPAAFTSPILVDFDGGGYLAPFAPQ